MKQIYFYFLPIILIAPSLDASLQYNSQPPLLGVITEYGVYKVDQYISTKRDDVVTTGKKHTGKYHIVKKTNEIIPEIGSAFGFKCEILNVNNKLLEVDWVVTHPPMQMPNKPVSTGYQYKELLEVENGVAYCGKIYIFESHQEMTPGKWSFTYKINDKVLVSVGFVVGKRKSNKAN